IEKPPKFALHSSHFGGLAHLVERKHGMFEVIGSSPISSTKSGKTDVKIGFPLSFFPLLFLFFAFKGPYNTSMQRHTISLYSVIRHLNRLRQRLKEQDEYIRLHLPSLLTALEADRKSTRLNSSHVKTSYAVFCLKKTNRYIAARQSP